MKKRTLFEFLFSRTGFGKTSWISFAVILLAVLGMAWYALFSGADEPLARWVSGGFAAAITAVMTYGTWRNYNGKQA